MNKFTLIASVVAFSAFNFANADVETYQGHGVVQSVDQAAHTISVKQDAVTDLGWPVKVQSYTIDGSKIAEGVKAGEAIDFTFTADSASPSIHYIHVTNL